MYRVYGCPFERNRPIVLVADSRSFGVVRHSTVRYSGDDSFAMWSVGAGQNNVTFRNNRAYHPHQGILTTPLQETVFCSATPPPLFFRPNAYF